MKVLFLILMVIGSRSQYNILEVIMTRNAVLAPNAAAIGPYSHAVWGGDLVYLSGQTPIDPATAKLLEGDVAAQTDQCFQNLFAVLKAAGLTPDHVVKVNVYLLDMNDFVAMNTVYSGKFQKPYPARTTIGVAALPLGARVEIEMVAHR
jgi:2-iminobutanoate/2-iminopropanoate deaminase